MDSSIQSEGATPPFGQFKGRFEMLLLKNLRKNHEIVIDIADLPHLQPIYFGDVKNYEIYDYRRFFQLVNIAHSLLFISSGEIKLFDSDKLRNKKQLLVPNASNPKFFKKTALPSKGEKNILCVSGYAPMRGIDILADAFDLIRKKHKDTFLRLVGYNMPFHLNREGVIIERNKFYKDMPKIYSEAYVCVIPHRKNPYMDMALPIKLFDAMAPSRPVIVTRCSEMAQLVEKEKCGVITDDSADSLCHSIKYLLSNHAIAEEMGIRGREAVEKRHSWVHRAKIIKQYLKES